MLCVTAFPALSQVVSPSDCATAAAAVNGAPLPAPGDTVSIVAWAWPTLTLCDSVGVAAAVTALQTTAVVSEVDSARIDVFFAMFSRKTSTAMFNAWQSVIVNSQASDYFKRMAILA
jgi:hypothetical protein